MSTDRPSVVLFRPKSTYGVVYVPWSLLAIAAPLVRDGVRVRIIDENADPDWRRALNAELSKKPVCLGVTTLTGRMLAGAIEASCMASGKVPVVWGGVHASLLQEQTARAPYVDYVVCGEGEASFPRLVNCLANGAAPDGIPGVYLEKGGQVEGAPPGPFINLADEPPVPYELINAEAYVSGWFGPGGRVLDIFTSRGCPHRCKFCYNPAFNARKWRSFDAKTAWARIDEFVRRFRLSGIIIRDDFFFAKPTRAREIAEMIVDMGPRIEWEADCRVDIFSGFDDDFLDLMVRSGLKKLVFGVESGAPRVLEAIGKDITLDQLWKTVDGLRRHKINSAFHFMIGFPGETKEEVLETYALIEKLKSRLPDSPIYGPNVYAPYPGTELFKEAVERGFRPPETPEGWVNFEGWTFANAPWVSAAMEAMLDVSRVYFRMGEVFPMLRPIGRARRAMWAKSSFTPKIERMALSMLLSLSAGTWIKRLHLKRWANR